MSGHQFLHPILPCEFLDSPEFESSRATIDEKFKVRLLIYTFNDPSVIIITLRQSVFFSNELSFFVYLVSTSYTI